MIIIEDSLSFFYFWFLLFVDYHHLISVKLYVGWLDFMAYQPLPVI